MRIILDAMSGDTGCEAVVLGAALARTRARTEITLVGDEPQLKGIFVKNAISMDGFSILHAPQVITMEDDPVRAVREKLRQHVCTEQYQTILVSVNGF